MIPAEGGLVDLGEGQATALVGVLDVGEVIVEVVEGVVPAGGLVGGDVGHGEAFWRAWYQAPRRRIRKIKSCEDGSQAADGWAQSRTLYIEHGRRQYAEEAHLALTWGGCQRMRVLGPGHGGWLSRGRSGRERASKACIGAGASTAGRCAGAATAGLGRRDRH